MYEVSKQPLVSIIIPTYNRARLIGETLDSVVAQTYMNWECIVVDDGSSDGTETVMKAYCEKDPRFKYYHRPVEHLPGGNGARNYGFKKSKGEYVNWFDSDDLMDESLIAAQITNLISSNAAMSICLYDRYNYNFSKIITKAKEYNIKYSLYLDYILKLFGFNLQTTLFCKKLLLNYKLKENLLKSQEYEFLQRILRDSESKYDILNEALVKIRSHENSITGKINDKKLISLLEVSAMIIEELPKQASTEIKNKLVFHHIQNLKIAYLNKNTFIFFRYLHKLSNKFFFYKLIFSLLYWLFYLTNKGQMKYRSLQFSLL